LFFFVDLVNARDNPRPERRRRKKKIPKKIRPQTHKHTQTHREPLDGWMDGWTNVELLILPNFSLSPGHSLVKEKGRGEEHVPSLCRIEEEG
jgi:hypothetical protein